MSTVREWPSRGLEFEKKAGVYLFDSDSVDKHLSNMERGKEDAQGDGENSNDELRRQRIEKTAEEVRRLKRENDHEDAELVLRSDIIKEYSRDLLQIKSKCREWLNDVKAQFPDLQASEAERMDKEFIELFNSFINDDN